MAVHLTLPSSVLAPPPPPPAVEPTAILAYKTPKQTLLVVVKAAMVRARRDLARAGRGLWDRLPLVGEV